MKKLFILLGVTTSLLAGCATNSTVGPALVRLGVSTSAGYTLVKYPAARPGVAAGREIVCAVASGQDLSPVAVVAALDAAGVAWTPEAWFAINGAVGAYNLAWNGLGEPGTAKARPYLEAVCGGLTDALGAPAPVTRSAALEPTSRWPQVR